MGRLVLALAALATLASHYIHVSAESCPDVARFRSSNVVKKLDPSRLEGLWYESAFIDPAQIGASCQTLNVTYDASSGRLTAPFAVKYGPLPFTIVELYDPKNETGTYNKHVNMPGGSLVNLATVIVDATAPDDSSPYDTLTMFSCLGALGQSVKEMVFAQRVPITDNNTFALSKMEAVAQGLQVPYDSKSLKLVSRKGC